MSDSTVDELFPFETPRENQYSMVDAILSAFYEKGYKNVVLDSPVGSGKSGVNTTIARYADDAFMTTPVVDLRQQLEEDEVLNQYYNTLKGRRDYICGVTGDNCSDCSINNSSEQSCANQGNCTYWKAKLGAMGADTAVITFSYLVIDSMLPEFAGGDDDGTKISFGDRELLVVDEAHGIEQQVAQLHAGVDVTPYSIPVQIYDGVVENVSYDAEIYGDVRDAVVSLKEDCEDFIDASIPQNMTEEESSASKFVDKINWVENQYENNDKEFVVDVDSTRYGQKYYKTINLTPVDVSSFLRNFVWSRANKRLISTATMPYQSNPDMWLRSIGLDPEKTQVISVGMTFDVANRPIFVDPVTVCSMSGGGDEDNWPSILERLNELASNHKAQKGLVHTVSYNRANKVLETVDEDEHPNLHNNIIVHDGEEDMDVFIERWQDSDHDIVLSPSMMEGIDLPGQKCRWQVLMKVPYIPRGNKRFQYLLNERPEIGWKKYYEVAMNRMVQSYGRAIRSKDDYASYYVLDEDFNKLCNKAKPPEWFSEAVDIREPKSRSLYNY